ncbi:hypothetical protein TNCV_3596151 [Trichonephila clavipes]|nr:hypothetical protein TNCV_3596151 [Trichonephila clavipes]
MVSFTYGVTSGYLKNVLYSKKMHTLEKLLYEIETACHVIAIATLRDVTNNACHRAQKCLEASGLQFEHLL